jgi:5-methylcytosine-specific restriction protein A
LFEDGENLFPEEISNESASHLIEGSLKQITVNVYERNVKARNECITFHGTSCKVCGFNFEEVYGDAGKDYIHVHHIIPLSEIKVNYEVNPVEDLIPVCPNCHSMLHRFNPILTVEQLKVMIQQNIEKVHLVHL